MQYRPPLRGRYAQQWDAFIFAEKLTLNQRVPGSSPGAPTMCGAVSFVARAAVGLAEHALSCDRAVRANAVEPRSGSMHNSRHIVMHVYNTCFDRYCPCTGADNYFISYGRKYCDRFLNETGWSAAGKQWRDKTLLCLQKSIAAKLSLQSPTTCDCREMKEFAFQTHINCYTQNTASVCKLPIADWRKIVSIVDTADVIDSYGAKQVLATLKICISDYSIL
jgi:hypothetical protein